MNIEETVRRRWAAFEPIMRTRIMQEAYDCADKGDFEAYNSIKKMAGEVLKLAEEMVLAERKSAAIKFLWQECGHQKRINAQLLEALEALVKIPALTHGVLVKLSDAEEIIEVARAAIKAAKGHA
jgi:hypothetical protein